MKKEIWKDIVGYEGRYQISNRANVKSLKIRLRVKGGAFRIKNEKILKPILGKRGYFVVFLWDNYVKKTANIHRLLMEHFVENPENKMCINHINGIKTDNRLENLEWATHTENNRHSWANGLNRSGNIGKTGYNSIRGIPVEQYSLDGVLIAEFGSGLEAKRETGVADLGINLVCSGKKLSAGGFIWKRKQV
ncbi:MAG: NUMOD4 domain-containing protein [Candidatus Doudnabacteria bacterium]